MAENFAAASRPGAARAHASDNNSGKSFRINMDLECGLRPAYGPAHGTCSALLPAVRAMAKIMHGPQRIISEEIGICYRRFGAEPRPDFSSVERAGFARTLVAGR